MLKLINENNFQHPLFNDYPDAVFTLDLEGTFISANKALIDLAECTKEELFKLSFMPFIAPGHAEKAKDYFKKTIQGEIQNFDTSAISARGTRRVLNVTNLPIVINQEVIGIHVIAKDITERKRASEQLNLEKEKYRELFNLSPLPQWVYDFDTLKFLDVNDAAIKHYGYSKAEFLAMTIRDIRPSAEMERLQKILDYNLKPGTFNQSMVRHQKKTGELMYVSVKGNSVVFEGKNARLVLAIDQTEQINAELKTEESINRFNVVSKATSDAIWDLDMQTGQIIWNHGIKGIFGHKFTSCNLEWWKEQVHPNDLKKVFDQFELLIQQKKSRLQVEYRFRCADGNYKSVLDRSFILFNKEGKAVRMIGSMQDITERINHIKAIETQNEQLRDISWIQAHEVRAPLARIMSLSQLLNEDNNARASIRELSTYLIDSARQLDQVINNILEKANLNSRNSIKEK